MATIHQLRPRSRDQTHVPQRPVKERVPLPNVPYRIDPLRLVVWLGILGVAIATLIGIWQLISLAVRAIF